MVTELKSLLSSSNLPGGLDHIYPVFFPQGVQIQDSGGDFSVPGGNWCGEHSAVPWNGDQLIYAEDAYPPADGGCGGAQAPNGNPFADAAIGTLSHEVIEAITDPDGVNLGKRAWNDSSGHEIGDECNQIYGLPLGSTDPANPQGSEYNQVINGGKYYIQEEYSNASFASKGFAKGCVQNEGNGAAGDGQSAHATPLSATSDSASPSDSDTSDGSDSSGSSGQPDTTSGSDGVIDAGGDGYSLFLYGSPRPAAGRLQDGDRGRRQRH